MRGIKAKKLRREIRRQYWKGIARRPWGWPWFIWEWMMKRAYFSFFPKRN